MLLVLAIGLVALTVGLAAYYAGMGVVRSQSEARIVALRRTRAEVLEAGFADRAVGPFIRNIGRQARRLTPAGWARTMQQKFQLADWSDAVDANSWAAIKVLSTLGGFLFWLVIQGFFDPLIKVMMLALLLFVGFFVPNAMLQRAVDERREEMRRQLPDVIDLLVISVEAGLGFEAALARVVATLSGAMTEEFGRMLQETRVGVSRADAMRSLSARTDLDELDSFLLAMAQAEAFGVSIARVLRVQSDEMRVARRQRAQERAFAAPVKMVFPMVLCLLPAIFLVLLGPAAIEIFEIFSD